MPPRWIEESGDRRRLKEILTAVVIGFITSHPDCSDKKECRFRFGQAEESIL
jgi:hypothetical protein